MQVHWKVMGDMVWRCACLSWRNLMAFGGIPGLFCNKPYEKTACGAFIFGCFV
jgi:hypothetical protein